MNIDQKIVKFRGQKIEIKDMLKNGDDITIIMKGTIIEEAAKDNQDGSVNMIYEFKPAIMEIEDHELDTQIRDISKEDEFPIEDVPFPGL